MQSLRQSIDADIELAATAKEGNDDKDGDATAATIAESASSNGKEIVRSVEDNVNDVRNKEDDRRRESNASECSVEILDLEPGDCETKLHLSKSERDCRICQLSFDASNDCGGLPIELGCSCKDDLAAAHRQCAEAWFKIKGNKICEICGSIAQNVPGVYEHVSIEEPWDERNNELAMSSSSSHQQPQPEARRFWQGHRFLNFLLACMVFAFVVSWLFHFNVPS